MLVIIALLLIGAATTVVLLQPRWTASMTEPAVAAPITPEDELATLP